MATTLPETGDPFRIGRVFNNVFGVIGRNPLLYLGLAALIAGLPQGLFQLLVLQPITRGAATASPLVLLDNMPRYGVVWFVMAILGALLQSALCRATIEDLSGRKPAIGECLATGLSVLPPLLGISILVTLGAWLGMILLIVPGIILWLGWSVATPVLIQERLGVFGSMSRSRQLTRGSRWSLFGLYLIIIVLAWIIQAGVGFTIGLTSALSDGLVMGVVRAMIAGTISATFAMLIATASAASYIELRQTREGTEVSELAEIFA